MGFLGPSGEIFFPKGSLHQELPGFADLREDFSENIFLKGFIKLYWG